VDIPPEKRRVLVQQPNKLIQLTLQELEKWENEYLNAHPKE